MAFPVRRDRAMSRSQRGPFAAAPFVALPTSRFSKFDAQVFRVLLRRRLRLPLPLSSRSCRCGRLLDPLGHHRAGCSEAGGVGETWLPAGKSSRTSLSRSGSSGEHQRLCPRHGLGGTQPSGKSKVGGGGGRPLSVERFSVGHRHDTGVAVAQRWQSTSQGGHTQRSCPPVRPQEEVHHVSGARTCTVGGVGGGSGWTVLGRSSIFRSRPCQGEVSQSASGLARPRQRSPLSPVRRQSLSLCRCWTTDQRATREWTRRQCTRWCGIADFCEVTGQRAPVVVFVE